MYSVLLVDDEPAILAMERRAIARGAANFSVVGEAYNVETAKKIYNAERPAVILTDIKMPRENGIRLIQYIADREDDNSVMVAVSGYDDFAYVHDAFTYGAFDYLLKPVEPKKIAELFGRIERLLVSLDNTPAPAVKPKVGAEALTQEICDYVAGHLAENNSILSICTKFGISQPYLSKIFKKCRNTTYNECLTGIKIAKAKQLLEQKEAYLIGEVAELVGFSDQFYFSKVFKSTTGLTPREYRRSSLPAEMA